MPTVHRRAPLALALLASAGCSVTVHLEAGVRRDTLGAAVHVGAAVGIGFANGSPVRKYESITHTVGADADTTHGARPSTTLAYLHGGPGPLMHRVAFTWMHRAPRMSGALLYVLHERDVGGRCWFEKNDADCGDRKLSIGALGLQLSGTVDEGHPGGAADLVFELHH